MSITEEIIDIPAEHIRNVFGEFDHYIKNIERALNVTIIARGGSLKIIGEAAKIKAGSECTESIDSIICQRRGYYRSEC